MISKTTNGILHLAVAQAIPLQLEYREAKPELRIERQKAELANSQSQGNDFEERAR